MSYATRCAEHNGIRESYDKERRVEMLAGCWQYAFVAESILTRQPAQCGQCHQERHRHHGSWSMAVIGHTRHTIVAIEYQWLYVLAQCHVITITTTMSVLHHIVGPH